MQGGVLNSVIPLKDNLHSSAGSAVQNIFFASEGYAFSGYAEAFCVSDSVIRFLLHPDGVQQI
jgi:hypothetical protein